MSRREHLIVFAREPRVGAVKRRLSKGLGAVAATFWYRRQLSGLLRRLASRTGGGPATWRRHLFVTPRGARRGGIWPRGWILHAQAGGDLGERMHAALASVGTGPAVLVGSDIPDIRPRHIRAAFRALGQADVVLGPAADGGYWLIGVRGRRAPPRFGPVRWSSEHALADTIAGFSPGTKVILLETLQDVDEASDLENR
jgi:uncharacterized protein